MQEQAHINGTHRACIYTKYIVKEIAKLMRKGRITH